MARQVKWNKGVESEMQPLGSSQLEEQDEDDGDSKIVDPESFEIDVEEPSIVLTERTPRLKRLHEVWPSRNRFFCAGALMTGGETEFGVTRNCSVPNLCAWSCILIPCSVYFLWVFPYLWGENCYAMPLATLCVFLVTCGFLLAACCSDPGIIPRREVIVATKSSDELKQTLGYDPLAPSDENDRHVPADLSRLGYRWCRTCRIIRPPRASHCPDCDNCVMRYDHHCPFVNNCVGQRNYHFFFGFITSVMCLAIMVLPVLFWFLNSDNFEASVGAMSSAGTSSVLQPLFVIIVIVGILIGIAAILSTGLWGYHVFLSFSGKTTKEFVKGIEKVEDIADEPTLCAARGPRLFNPWTLVDPRDLIRADGRHSADEEVGCCPWMQEEMGDCCNSSYYDDS